MKWLENDINLRGEIVDLIPMENYHIDELVDLANDKRIWQFYIFDGTDSSKMRAVLSSALSEKENGSQFPFVIVEKSSGNLIGSTRLLDIVPVHRKLEIGSTWLHPDYWGTPVNLECKLLLLTFCFEELNALRVQLKTDENNIRSRKAIEKIGGIFEGVFRNDMLRENGTHRNSAYYSLIDTEWEMKKTALISLFQAKKLSSDLH